METHKMRVHTAVAVAFCLLVAGGAAGCKKKAPQTAPDVVAKVPTAAAPVAEAPETLAETADPWGWDLDEINRRLQAEGLLADVYFEYDRAELRREARERLDANARFLRDNPQFVVAIEGHCDERGTVDYNLALGQQRAGASQQYVELLGVPAGQLRSMSYGKERPVCTDPAEACWWRNRRAHFVVVERTGAS